MAEERSRDRVWKFALQIAIRNQDAAYPSDIADIADVSESTARDTLNVMADCGWLKRETVDTGRVRYRAPPSIEFNEEIHHATM